MMTRRIFGRAFACAAAGLLAAAASGCEDAGTEATPEIQKESDEARNRSIEALSKKGKSKAKS